MLLSKYTKNKNQMIDQFDFLGDCYQNLKQYQKALEFYNKALSCYQTFTYSISIKIMIIYYKRSLALYQLENYQLALKQFYNLSNLLHLHDNGFHYYYLTLQCLLKVYQIKIEGHQDIKPHQIKNCYVFLTQLAEMQCSYFGKENIFLLDPLKLLINISLRCENFQVALNSFKIVLNILKKHKTQRQLQFIPILQNLKQISIKKGKYNQLQIQEITLFEKTSYIKLKEKYFQKFCKQMFQKLNQNQAKIFKRQLQKTINSVNYLNYLNNQKFKQNRSQKMNQIKEQTRSYFCKIKPQQQKFFQDKSFNDLVHILHNDQQKQRDFFRYCLFDLFIQSNKYYYLTNPKGQIDYYKHKGEEFIFLSQYQQSIKYFQKALQMVEKNLKQENKQFCLLYFLLGKLYNTIKNKEKAAHYYSLIQKYIQENHYYNNPLYINYLLELGDFNKQQGELKKAVKYYDKAKKIVQIHINQNKQWLNGIWQKIYNFYQSYDSEISKNIQKKIFDYTSKHDLSYKINLAKISFQNAEKKEKQGNWNLAIFKYQQSIELIKDQQDKDYIRSILTESQARIKKIKEIQKSNEI